MLIRKATEKDLSKILELWSLVNLPLKPHGRDQPEKIVQQIATNNACLFIAEIDNKIVGVVLITHDSRKGWINRLATHPNNRRIGIAEELLRASEKYLQEKGIEVFAALIEESNIESQEFFKKNNYNYHKEIRYFSKRLSSNS